MMSEALPNIAQKCEMAEAMAWRDMVEAASDDYKKEFNLGIDVIDSATYITCPSIPFVHFNCALGFGMDTPLTESNIDALLDYVTGKELKLFFVYLVDGLQPGAEAVLSKKGFVASGSWDRIYRTNEPLSEDLNLLQPQWNISKVDSETTGAWSTFVSSTYRMPQTKKWLADFPVRKGWHHFILQQDNRVVAARSMFISEGGMCFCGVEAPIPGLMTPDYNLDFALMQHLLIEGLKMGVKSFTADIEFVNDLMDTDAYKNFKSLGFTIPYRRKIYKWQRH